MGIMDFRKTPDAGLPTRLSDASLNATYASNGGLVLSDDFTNKPDGGLNGRTPDVGPVWTGTGADLPTITSGTLRSASVGYAYVGLSKAPDTLTCRVEWIAPDSGNTMTMAWVNGNVWDLTNLAPHFNFGPTGYNVTIKQGSNFPPLFNGSWREPMVAGVIYDISVSIIGNQVVISANGDTHTSPVDPRISSMPGPYVFWEPGTVGAASSRVHAVAAFIRDTNPSQSAMARQRTLAQAGSLVDSKNNTVGSQYSMGQVTIGDDGFGNSKLSFGASEIFAALTTAVSAGATTFVSSMAFPPGTAVTFSPGTATTETQTTTGYPTGSGPYTHTLTVGLTNAWPLSTAITGVPSSNYQASMYLGMGNGYFNMPNVPVFILPGGKLYLGSSLDTFIERKSAGVAGPNGGWKLNTYTTAGRPTGYAGGQAGTAIYDTTLSKPVYWDGTTWRDSAGTAV
jgi:hypothetical protein